MMLSNDQIDRHVRTLVEAYLKGVKVRPEEQPALVAGTELVINVLQNLNDLAYASYPELNP